MKGSLDELAGAFVEGTLPKIAWTHDAHLRVGLWHALHHGPEEALVLLRRRIRALNDAHGVANSDTGGYHETITRFYVTVIDRFVRDSPEGEAPEAMADRLVAELGAKDLPLRHWSRSRLMSVEARRGWVEPDLPEGAA